MEDILRVDLFSHEASVVRIETENNGYSVMVCYNAAGDTRKVTIYFEDGETARNLRVGDKVYLCLEARS